MRYCVISTIEKLLTAQNHLREPEQMLSEPMLSFFFTSNLGYLILLELGNDLTVYPDVAFYVLSVLANT